MKINFLKLDHIQICIPKDTEKEARAFYCDILGLTEIPKPEAIKNNGGLWLALAGIELHIGIEEPMGTSKRHPAFIITNLKEVKAYLVKHQVLMRDEVKIPGAERFSIFDPWGNRIELIEKTSL
jgi:catechol-2,3-dioxygenase